LAETQGPYRNPVFQLYVAMAVLMTNFALATVLSAPWVAVVLAAECVCLAVTYRQSGFIVFKLINLAVLFAAVIYGAQVGANAVDDVMAWIIVAVVALVLLATAVLYTHGMPERAPEARKTSAQWTYADTALDLDVYKLAMFHGAGATLVLIALALSNWADYALLPFSLAAVAVALIAVGAIGRTPAVEFAGVMVLASAQAAYGYSLLAAEAPSTDAATLRLLAGALAVVSLAVAWRWDYTARRDESAGTIEYLTAIAAPYVAAGLVVATFVWETIVPEYGAAVLHAAALGCIILFWRWRSGGMRMVALTLMVAGAATFVQAHGWPALTGNPAAMYWWWFMAAALAPIVAERVLVYQYGVDRRPETDAARTILVVVACITGLVGVFSGAPEFYRAWGWLGMAGVAALCGIAFREGRYRWSAMIAIVAACVLVATQAAEHAEPGRVYAFVAAALVVGAVLTVSWAAAMRQQLGHRRQQGLPGDEG